MAAYNLQLKRKTASALENVYVSTKWELVDGKPSWIGSNKPSYTWSEIGSKPTTFSPSSHSHGNITNDGKIGTTANRVIVTGTGGVLTAKAAGTTSQFLRGDGSWATPTASASTSIDYNWTGEHVFQKQVTLTGDLSGGAPRYPTIKAKIYTPEGSYPIEWEMPSQSGKLALEGSSGGFNHSTSMHIYEPQEYMDPFIINLDPNCVFLEFFKSLSAESGFESSVMVSKSRIFEYDPYVNGITIFENEPTIYTMAYGPNSIVMFGGSANKHFGVIQHIFE